MYSVCASLLHRMSDRRTNAHLGHVTKFRNCFTEYIVYIVSSLYVVDFHLDYYEAGQRSKSVLGTVVYALRSSAATIPTVHGAPQCNASTWLQTGPYDTDWFHFLLATLMFEYDETR